MTRRSRQESDEEYLPSAEEELARITRNVTKRKRRKGKLPSYDYAKGEELVKEFLPTYKDVAMEKIWENKKIIEKQMEIVKDAWDDTDKWMADVLAQRNYWLNINLTLKNNLNRLDNLLDVLNDDKCNIDTVNIIMEQLNSDKYNLK